MMTIQKFGDEKMPSVINDPFAMQHVERISVNYGKKFFGQGMEAYGTVEFRNGDTKGEQKFSGATFDEVVVKIKAALGSL